MTTVLIQHDRPVQTVTYTNEAMATQSNGAPKLTPMKCSTCGANFFLQLSPTPPFCSTRCQQIDLGRWLDESIGVPFEGDSGDVPVEYRDDEPARSPLMRMFEDQDDDDDDDDDDDEVI
jgi:endogenous inhibitor of DNA gyrase (YacG/DUF329 family)